MSTKEKKLLIISKFINSESARLSVENKGRSIFSFFKKKSKEEAFIDELTSFFNKHSNADAEDNKFEEKLGKLLEKYDDKELPLKSRLTGALNEVSNAQNKQDNKVQFANFDFESFKKQMDIVFDSLKKLKKVIPRFSSKSATKRAYAILIKIYDTIKNTIESKKVSLEQSTNIHENLQNIQELVSSTISSRLIKKSKHFEDKSKINSTLSTVYDEFSNLNKILFAQPFKKLSDNVNNVTKGKGNQPDKPGGTDKTTLSYYINLVDSGLSKLKKYRSSDFWSIMKPSTFEQFYDNSQDKWNKAKTGLDSNIDESEVVFNDLVGYCQSNFKHYSTFRNVNLETKKDIEPYNEALNILVDLTNDIIEMYELLFKSNPNKQTFTKIQHVNYSEADFENAKNSNYKKMAIISKFINIESARLALENKDRSMFSKKSSEETFIDELNNFYNKHANDNKTFDKYLGDVLSTYEKDDKCPNMVKKLKDQINGIKQVASEKIKDFDKFELENQLKEVDDSLKNLKKVIPLFSGKSATKRAYTMLTKIYNSIKLNLENNKDEKQKSDIIYDNLNEVKTLIPSVISTRLVKKSKHFGDESKINRVLSDVYDEFSNLNNILFDSTFEKLDSTKIDNNAKFDTSDGPDKTRVSYYINLVDSGFSKLKKYRSSDFWPTVNSSKFEQLYDNLKIMWDNAKKYLDANEIKNKYFEKNLHKLLAAYLKPAYESCSSFDNVDLKTTKDIDKYNEAVNILVDLTNDVIEIYELLFESKLEKKTFTRIKHVNYSEIEGIHGEAYDANNIKKIEMKDKDGKTVTKYFVKRSGDHIQGKVIYSGFLFDYADVDPKELDKQIRQNLKLSLDKKYKFVKDIFDKKLSAFNKTKAGEYGVRIIATAEGLGGKSMSSGIDDSYKVAEASVVEVSTKIISKKIKIRVYVACKALTISQMLFGKNPEGFLANMLSGTPAAVFNAVNSGSKTALSIKNCLSPGKLKLISCLQKYKNVAEEDIKKAGNIKKAAKENLEKLKDAEWDPRSEDEKKLTSGFLFFGGGPKISMEDKRNQVKEQSESDIQNAEEQIKMANSKLKNINFDSKLKNINSASILKGDYLLASVPIKKSDVKLPKENENAEGIVVQKESWMNPGKIWFTMSLESSSFNDKIQEVLKEKNQSGKMLESTDVLACVSDIGLDITAMLVNIKIQIRLYISLNGIISNIAKNLVDIKLKTPKGKIELN